MKLDQKFLTKSGLLFASLFYAVCEQLIVDLIADYVRGKRPMFSDFIISHEGWLLWVIRITLFIAMLVCFWWDHISQLRCKLWQMVKAFKNRCKSNAVPSDSSLAENTPNIPIEPSVTEAAPEVARTSHTVADQEVNGRIEYTLEEAINKALAQCEKYLNAPEKAVYRTTTEVFKRQLELQRNPFKTKAEDSKKTIENKSKIELVFKTMFPNQEIFSDADISSLVTKINVGKFNYLW